jgi:hypothetical protein
MKEKTIKQINANFCWMCSSLLASVNMTEFQTAEAYSSLDLPKVKCSMQGNSREEKL